MSQTELLLFQDVYDDDPSAVEAPEVGKATGWLATIKLFSTKQARKARRGPAKKARPVKKTKTVKDAA